MWIVQRDTRGPFAEVSRVPPNLVHRALAVPGVRARRFVYHTIQRERSGKPLRIAVLGLSWPTDKGEWVPLTAGRPLGQSHFEMIADKSLGTCLGEQLELGKETYTVVGITSSMISSSGDGIAFFTSRRCAGHSIRRRRAKRSDWSELLERRADERTELATKQPHSARKRSTTSCRAARHCPTAVERRDGFQCHREPIVEQVANTISGWGDVSVFTQDGTTRTAAQRHR